MNSPQKSAKAVAEFPSPTPQTSQNRLAFLRSRDQDCVVIEQVGRRLSKRRFPADRAIEDVSQ
jgi:hypothetical protein